MSSIVEGYKFRVCMLYIGSANGTNQWTLKGVPSAWYHSTYITMATEKLLSEACHPTKLRMSNNISGTLYNWWNWTHILGFLDAGPSNFAGLFIIIPDEEVPDFIWCKPGDKLLRSCCGAIPGTPGRLGYCCWFIERMEEWAGKENPDVTDAPCTGWLEITGLPSDDDNRLDKFIYIYIDYVQNQYNQPHINHLKLSRLLRYIIYWT